MRSTDLSRRAILIVEEEPVIALDVKAALEGAGATVVWKSVREAAETVEQQAFAAAILDLRPGSNDHRPIARELRKRRIPFLFYSTHKPEDVTTVRGAPVILKPARADDIVKSVALLLRGDEPRGG
jgi:DNA-binding response OmpR family regulator